MRLLAARREMKQIVNQLADCGNARRPADQDNFIDLFGCDAGISQRLLARANGAAASTGSINCSKTSRGISR